MRVFLKDRLLVDFDGIWNINEIVMASILLVLTVLIVLVIVKLVKKIVRKVNPRKDTIFSHRKNKYKNSIGKKNKY